MVIEIRSAPDAESLYEFFRAYTLGNVALQTMHDELMHYDWNGTLHTPDEINHVQLCGYDQQTRMWVPYRDWRPICS